MKTTIILSTFLALSAWASPPPQQEQDQQEQDQQQGQCHTCRPRVFTCHARLVDCYGRPLMTYWARGPQYQGACRFALNLCLRDASWGYGGYGARCFILGK